MELAYEVHMEGEAAETVLAYEISGGEATAGMELAYNMHGRGIVQGQIFRDQNDQGTAAICELARSCEPFCI